ncbi:DUF2058 domain-containing protein [Marinomonas rhizomae]|uniref:Nucleoprotein/polynucleotide-associated enzyme n=1 Tax=Marinomonas rhizomae TaxID=491948 RepID=A0A366J5Q3_9GAMM|nr:DUF2058 domain-containing protein [Marinomonas rhizomae]RBP82363.1 hypothetical protein DFP80_1084 [Marinomonas rhizomae]RNF73837.1 DUF2058 domain-containing protein [Marinomonas rhizomae]
MATKSLQEQLLGAGLVDKKKVKKLKAESLQLKQKIKKGKVTASGDDDRREELKRQREEKAERDRVLNMERQKLAEQKAVHGQIRQMIEQNRVRKQDGDIAYHFTDNKKVKQLYISQSMHDDLSRGRLAIVRLDELYEILPEPVAVKISERDSSYILVCNNRVESIEDDPYADFQIPDDLMW